MAQSDSFLKDQTISLVVEAFTKVAKDLSDNPELVRVEVGEAVLLSTEEQDSKTGEQKIIASAN